ncbi:MAG: acetoacetate--CoA ligase [Gemmatimonadaceae bacterium]
MRDGEGDNVPLWSPTSDDIARARLTHFIADLTRRGVVPADVADSHSLQHWSVENPEQFWGEIWRAAKVVATTHGDGKQWTQTLVGANRMAPPDKTLGPRWFTDASLNFSENLLRRNDDHVAIVAWTERGRESTMSYAELQRKVAATQNALHSHGVAVGDRVVGYLPNIPEAIVAMLATVSLGAIWSSCSPDFGTKGVLDRFGQIEPKVMIAADGYRYSGKVIDCKDRIADVATALPSLQAVWIVANIENAPDISSIRTASLWGDMLHANATSKMPTFARLPFDHPLYVLYSSGTTGLPKCMVHGAGGTLLQHWKEHALHTDISANDVVFYFTTCGWMMWNWLVSALTIGATIVLYDGAPLAPDPSILLRMAEAERITIFGTSAKYLALLEKEIPNALSTFNLKSVRAILSTGSPLAAHSYDFVYKHLTHGVRLASISGGTDIVSCFALGDPTQSVWRGELQMRGLGMAVDVFDDDGKPLSGEPGELVCTKPFPSMPVAFWNDADGTKYRAAYFDHFPGVWRHGDWAEITAHDGVVIHGRSDATLNPGGVRIGTAEIYRQVEQIPEVLESLVVEQTMGDSVNGDTRMVLFVRMRGSAVLDDLVKQAIRRRLRENASPHHVPKLIVQIADLPRTISGKITELAVREVIHNRPVRNIDALANPESLALFKNLPELAIK